MLRVWLAVVGSDEFKLEIFNWRDLWDFPVAACIWGRGTDFGVMRK